jgi:hypothetical protein
MNKKNNSITFQTQTSTQIYLNSATADIYLNNTQKSSVVFIFRNPIILNKNAYEMRVSVVNCQIPISYYLINSTNNKFNITVNGITTSYYFKVGNYNVNSFITEWTNSIGAGWTLTYSNISNKITFGYTQNFTFSDDINSLFGIIGFKKGTSYSSSSNLLICPYVVNFSGITRLNIKSNCFTLNNVDSYNKTINRTIACIPVSSIINGISYYNNFTNYKNIFKNHEISTINIEIYDDFKNLIDFNNIDWTMTLQIDVISENTEDLDNLEDIYENLRQQI